MNRYIVEIKREDDEEPWLFLVFSEETREYVKEVIIEAQK